MAVSLFSGNRSATPVTRSEYRADSRTRFDRRGELTTVDDPLELTPWTERFPCIVEDISERGILLVCGRTLSVGQVLDLSCELEPGKTLECKVEIVHVGKSSAGARLTDIDDEMASWIKTYIRDQMLKRRQESSPFKAA